MSLPELHGWLPASALARREGVSPSTIRRRAARGAYDVIPSPLGPGALYREKGADPAGWSVTPPPGFVAVAPPRSAVIRSVGPRDRLVLGVLPASVSGIASHLTLSRGTAGRALARLERVGLACPAEVMPSGPKGGRPAVIWKAVA